MRPDLVATDNPRNPREYLERFFSDSWVADPRALQYLLDTCGAERVMLGTDYPIPLGEQTPGAGIDAMDLDEAGKPRQVHGTPLARQGLPTSRSRTRERCEEQQCCSHLETCGSSVIYKKQRKQQLL